MSSTQGIHHLGLTVHDVQVAGAFFVDALGFSRIERPDHPAVFVSDDAVLVTLWPVRDPGGASPFERYAGVGLHHVAFRIPTLRALRELHASLCLRPDVVVEFEPRPLGKDGTTHMMFAGPSGLRIELITVG